MFSSLASPFLSYHPPNRGHEFCFLDFFPLLLKLQLDDSVLVYDCLLLLETLVVSLSLLSLFLSQLLLAFLNHLEVLSFLLLLRFLSIE